MPPHRSDSSVQQQAEAAVLHALADEIGVPLAPRALTLPGGARCIVDGASDDESVLVEVFARQGALKSGQRGKVARDALKLLALAQRRPDVEHRLVLALADTEAAAALKGSSWLAEALETLGIEIRHVEIDAEARAGIGAAQVRQVMVNPQGAAQPPPAI